MRPSQILKSDMPGPKVYGSWWGDVKLQPQRGVITYTPSPFRQRAGKNMLRNWTFNFYRRVAPQVPYIIGPFIIVGSILNWAHNYDHWQNTKAGHQALHAAGQH